MMMMKMNRLSIESEYSVSQPAKNSGPGLGDSACGSANSHRTDPEEHGEPDEEGQVTAHLGHRRLVRAPRDHQQVDEQDADGDDDGDRSRRSGTRPSHPS